MGHQIHQETGAQDPGDQLAIGHGIQMEQTFQP